MFTCCHFVKLKFIICATGRLICKTFCHFCHMMVFLVKMAVQPLSSEVFADFDLSSKIQTSNNKIIDNSHLSVCLHFAVTLLTLSSWHGSSQDLVCGIAMVSNKILDN